MNSDIRALEPHGLWRNFADLNAVPRPSKKEERVIAFMKSFGQRLGLETIQDHVGNVIIKKPATLGMENRTTIVMQSHLDMVHQKNNDTIFDFETQGIQMYVDGDWVRAKGTTLGADNGLGVATIMALLESTDISHPAIEALFTIDEETGMTGALGLKGGILTGNILLNLDTEDDDELSIGCAGGIDVTATLTYQEETVQDGKVAYIVDVKGLQGGHSGMDIHKGLGNANKIMNRLFLDGFEHFGLQISSIHGGGLRNAIPRESKAIIVIDAIHEAAFIAAIKQLTARVRAELKDTEPNLDIKVSLTDVPEKVMNLGVQERIIKAIYAAQNGVYRMSTAINGLVETSNNIAKVVIADGVITISCLTRSSVETSKIDLVNTLRSVFELVGCDVVCSNDYPGWTPNMDSKILKLMREVYIELHNKEPRVEACHAGLECGILGTHYPNMEMISFGPTIRGAHSPDERASISSTQKYWNYLLEVLKRIPECS